MQVINRKKVINKIKRKEVNRDKNKRNILANQIA